ncbi:MAG: mannosyltransferase [Vezdaea aestivalis]|nr:MAG: mannosyltransferase [Vezdaea aestivalis]
METYEFLLTIAVFLSSTATIFLLCLPSPKKADTNVPSKTSVQILVLGDIGRSPRMQYHALSIAKHGGKVQLIGYRESDIHPELLKYSNVQILAISPPPPWMRTSNKLLFLIYGPLKVLWQLVSLWILLMYQTQAARWLLVQNPPSIPTLFISQVVCLFRNTHLLIDWHNFGYSILALKLGQSHPLVRILKSYEQFFSRFATAHLTVTDAMSKVLRGEFKVKAPIFPLHDRPPAHFKPFSALQQASFIQSLPETRKYAKRLETRSMRLAVSSTSWTPDEDFRILLEALVSYSTAASDKTNHTQLPDLLVIITGKGPQKSYYLSRIETLRQRHKLEHIIISTAWLSIEDYASLLASASIGISLHMSSSGVDLPMKVVDMFGAGLPVVAWNKFEACGELIVEGVNGRGFGSADQLDALLRDLLGNGARELEPLKQGALEEGRKRWDDVWNPVAGRLLGLCD